LDQARPSDTTGPVSITITTQKELESPTELAVYEALLEACQEQRAVVALSDAEVEELAAAAATSSRGDKGGASPSSGAAAGSAEARLLTLAFRREKTRVLDEAIERFGRLTGKGSSAGAKAAAAAAMAQEEKAGASS